MRQRRKTERGQTLVLFALFLVVILGFAAIVVDLGVLRNNRQILVNTLDAAALAGGTKLPVDGSIAPVGSMATQANNLINQTIQANYPGLPASAYSIAYKCLVGVDSANHPYISRDVPLVCNPAHAVGHTPPVNADFTGAGPTRTSNCNPSLGDLCNAVVITGSATTTYSLGPVVGVKQGSTGVVVSAACQGPCGAPPTVPVDLVVIIDRTASMSDADVTATRNAAKAVLGAYDPNVQRVALGLTGPSSISSACTGSPSGVYGKALTSATGYGTVLPVGGSAGDLKKWIPVGLTGNVAPSAGDPIGVNEAYLTGSPPALNAGTHLVAAINCFDHPGGTGTNLAVPIRMARAYLNLYGRTGVPWGILLETDGQPNYGVGNSADYTCAQSDADATLAKSQTPPIEIFTVGFGLDGSNDATCPDSSGTFKNKTATYLLSKMATQPSTNALGCPGTGTPNTNTDGDHYFCEPKTSDLTSVFKVVATTFAKTGARLVQLYPIPVVAGISPSTGTHLGGTLVTISGEYFSGATSVTVGGAAAAFTVTNDTTITVTIPPGASGSTVDVVVTTPGGVSPIVSSDHFTYT